MMVANSFCNSSTVLGRPSSTSMAAESCCCFDCNLDSMEAFRTVSRSNSSFSETVSFLITAMRLKRISLCEYRSIRFCISGVTSSSQFSFVQEPKQIGPSFNPSNSYNLPLIGR
mmetsp:Transcript_13233/g.16612  ORF Transcript_13233/g.16612 Transcript_13233/m.16612 type:complete len:114 (-) Transcript_13233:598-939(-)